MKNENKSIKCYIFLSLVFLLLLFNFSYIKLVNFYSQDLLLLEGSRVSRVISGIGKLKGFLNEQIDNFKKEIADGDFRIEINGRKVDMESNYHSNFVSVRIYKKGKPCCSIVMYPGRYENFLEISRRKKKGKYIDIGKRGSKILNILKQKVGGNVRIFGRFDKATFNQLESRLAYKIYKSYSKEYSYLSRLEVFIKTVDKINENSGYEIKASYVESFLSNFYPEVRTFNKFGFYYKMMKDSQKSPYELKKIFKEDIKHPVRKVRNSYFSSYSYGEVWELFHTLGAFSVSSLIKGKQENK